MALHPSFVYSKERRGLLTGNDAGDWWSNRNLLWGIINNAVKEVGAETVQMSDGQSNESGRDYVYGLERPEPPMTAEIAIEVGDLIVNRWERHQQETNMAGYCDTVSMLQSQTD